MKKLKDFRDYITECKLIKILSKCYIFLKQKNKHQKLSTFIKSGKPKKLFVFDLLIYNNKQIIVLGIDYFSGMIFGKVLKTKKAKIF